MFIPNKYFIYWEKKWLHLYLLNLIYSPLSLSPSLSLWLLLKFYKMNKILLNFWLAQAKGNCTDISKKKKKNRNERKEIKEILLFFGVILWWIQWTVQCHWILQHIYAYINERLIDKSSNRKIKTKKDAYCFLFFFSFFLSCLLFSWKDYRWYFPVYRIFLVKF